MPKVCIHTIGIRDLFTDEGPISRKPCDIKATRYGHGRYYVWAGKSYFRYLYTAYLTEHPDFWNHFQNKELQVIVTRGFKEPKRRHFPPEYNTSIHCVDIDYDTLKARLGISLKEQPPHCQEVQTGKEYTIPTPVLSRLIVRQDHRILLDVILDPKLEEYRA